MKASEMITALKEKIDSHGDVEVVAPCMVDGGKVALLPIERVGAVQFEYTDGPVEGRRRINITLIAGTYTPGSTPEG